MKAQMDLKRIFLTPPTTVLERTILFVMLVGFFAVFFRPLQFSVLSPLQAAATALMPACTLSWGWMVFLRSLFKKRDFMK